MDEVNIDTTEEVVETPAEETPAEEVKEEEATEEVVDETPTE